MIPPAEAHIAQCYQRLADRLTPLGLKRFIPSVGDDLDGINGIALAARYSRLSDRYVITAMVGGFATVRRALSPAGRHPFFESLLFLVSEDPEREIDLEEVRDVVMAEGDFVGLSKALCHVPPTDERSSAHLTSNDEKRVTYQLTQRRADARLLLDERGLTLLAGSKTSPMDSQPGFIRPLRQLFSSMIASGQLAPDGAVWRLTTDVPVADCALAASLMMLTAGTEGHWVPCEDAK